MEIKKFTLSLVLAMAAVFTTQAQKNDNFDERIKNETQQMVENLKLNDEQASQVLEINQKYGKLMLEVRKNANGNRDKMRSEMKELRDEHNQSLKKILSDDQYKKHLENIEIKRKKRKAKHQEGRGGRF